MLLYSRYSNSGLKNKFQFFRSRLVIVLKSIQKHLLLNVKLILEGYLFGARKFLKQR